MIFKNQEIKLDAEGYLLDLNQWSPELAEKLAEKEGLILTEQHWLIINFVRNYYLENETTPAIRLLVKSLSNEYGSEIGNSRYLQRIFKDSPAKTVAKLAGLSKPAKCL